MLNLFREYRLLILVVVVTFSLDQTSKYITIQNLSLGQSWPATGFFRFTHIANTGSAFGLFNNQNFILTLAAFVGIGILVYFYRSSQNASLWTTISLGLVLSGAIGNLTDRILIGHVTDFIDIGPWYIFNIADASIVTGMIILISSKLFLENPTRYVPHHTVSYAGDDEYES